MSCYPFMDQQRGSYCVRLLYQVLEVAPARYYAWRKQAPSPATSAAPVVWEAALEKAFTRHHKRYGTRRLRVELREEDHRVGRAQALTAHGLRCAPNRLLDQPAPSCPN